MNTVLDLVEDAVRRYPDEPALLSKDSTVSYAGLWESTARIARRLRADGIGPGDVVALAAERSTDLVVALIGILRSGAAFLPLDASYPVGRLGFMLDDSGVRVLVGHRSTAERLCGPGRTAVYLEELPEDGGDAELPEPESADVAYVLYTSGTTGAPKGIVMPHRELANIVSWQIGASACGPGDRTLQFSTISFDVAFQEIFATLGTGGTVVCMSEDQRQDPTAMWDVITRERVARVFLPYVALQALVLVSGADSPGDTIDLGAVRLREIITAGEQLQCTRALRELMRLLPDCRLVNQYGPSEAHVVTWHPLSDEPGTWPALPPIGVAVPGNRVYVLDGDGEPVRAGEIGEIHVGGVQVAYGYWNRPALSAERFTPEPGHPGERMYHTGDVARVRADGGLDFLGRSDDQVKIRGFRLELAEVEAALSDHPAVSRCGVAVRGDDGLEKVLVGFVVTDEGADLDGIRVWLHERLPDYMVPGTLRRVPEIPRMPSGKVDRPQLRLMAELA